MTKKNNIGATDVVDTKDYNDDVDMIEAARRNIFRYALETFTRAFPSAYDGLKPVHRRILYSMWEDKCFTMTKVATITGAVLGRYHPHSDSAVGDALVRLAQPWVMSYPYIEGKGNFGTQDGDGAAASRYIEAKLSQFARKVIFDDIDDVSVNYADNFNYTRKIPDYFPTRIPLVLVNGIDGLGEAFRVSIPPHNLNEVADICIRYINNPNISNEELVDGFYPDFPTGGEIVNGAALERFYKKGESTSIIIRGKAKLDRETNTIVLTEFPYGIDRDNVMMSVIDGVKSGNMILSGIENIQDVNTHDDSANEGDFLAVGKSSNSKKEKTYEYRCKKDSSMVEILNEIYKVTPFKSSIVLSFMINQKGYPVYVTVKDIVEQWYKIRFDSKRRKHTSAVSDSVNKRHVYEGILSAYSKIDEIINVIRSSKGDKDATITTLRDKFGLTKVQAKGVVEMSLISLSSLGEQDLRNKIDSLSKFIDENEYCLTHIDKIIIDELNELKRLFGRPRRTTVIANIEDHVTSKVTVTKGSLLWSRTSIGLYDANGVRDSKNIITGLKATKVVGRNVREIIGGVALKNTPIGFIVCYDNGGVNRIDMNTFRVVNVWYEVVKEEPYISCATPIYSEDDILICVTNDNKIKRVKASDIKGKRILNAGSVIKSIACFNEDVCKGYENILMVNSSGMYNMCQIDDIPLVGRSASGVKSAFDENDRSLIEIMCVPDEVLEEERILISSFDKTENQNYMHSIPLEDLKLGSRTAKPKPIGVPKQNVVTSINLVDVGEKDTQICMIGKSSTSSLNISNFKKPYDFRRLFITVTSSTQI